jgi:hypothetical protein
VQNDERPAYRVVSIDRYRVSGDVEIRTTSKGPRKCIREMNFYVRLTIVILVLYALAQFIPEAVNTFLTLLLISMILLQPEVIAREVERLAK